jgi:hypothetical protein
LFHEGPSKSDSVVTNLGLQALHLSLGYDARFDRFGMLWLKVLACAG